MAKNTAHLKFNVSNVSAIEPTVPLGIMFVAGETEYGIPNNPEDVITSVEQFERLYGGPNNHSDFPLLCELALTAGAMLRVCKITGDGSLPATASIENPTSEVLASFSSKGVGEKYNDNLTVTVAKATDLHPDHFNLTVSLLVQSINGDQTIIELYENLVKAADPAAPYTWLKPVVDNSALVDVHYADLGLIGGDLLPMNQEQKAAGGVDDLAIDEGHYAGSSVNKTGLHAFDAYSDSFVIATPAVSEAEIVNIFQVGKGYATQREDLIYFYAFSNTLDTATEITQHLDTLIGNRFSGSFGGGVEVIDPVNGGTKEVYTMGELLGIVATSHTDNGVWVSPTNTNGDFSQAIRVVNDFGSPASMADRNLIANSGGNMAVNDDGAITQWDFYSMVSKDNTSKFLTIVFLELYIKKMLRQYLRPFLTKPNHPTQWAAMYTTVTPFLDSLVGDVALYGYEWIGDQFATSLDDLEVNNPTDVANGKYKAKLKAVTVSPMIEIEIDIELSGTQITIS